MTFPMRHTSYCLFFSPKDVVRPSINTSLCFIRFGTGTRDHTSRAIVIRIAGIFRGMKFSRISLGIVANLSEIFVN